MTILNVGDKIRCIAHYSTSTTRGNVYEIGKVVGTNTNGRITYHYVDDDADDDDNMDTIFHDRLSKYFEVVDRYENVSTNEMRLRNAEALNCEVASDDPVDNLADLAARVSELESVIKRIKEAVAND